MSFFQGRNGKIKYGEATQMMGILNVTPDSFSDGGVYFNMEKAVNHAIVMVDAGATIIDIGGESTRPGYTPVSADEELSRIMPVLSKLRGWLNETRNKRCSDVLISIDTTKESVARACLEAGADILNDVSGDLDSTMIELAAEFGAGIVLMHNGNDGNACFEDIKQFFIRAVEVCFDKGILGSSIMLDPGIGFGKSQMVNEEIVRRLPELCGSVDNKVPILLAASRKRLVGNILGTPPEQRFEGDAAISTLAVVGGCDFVRVHEVDRTAKVLAVADAIIRNGEVRFTRSNGQIALDNMIFHGYHGVLEKEKQDGQDFVVDVKLEVDLTDAVNTDDVCRTVNYAEVYELVKKTVEGKPFELIETLGAEIGKKVLTEFQMVQEIELSIRKPQAPIEGYEFGPAVRQRFTKQCFAQNEEARPRLLHQETQKKTQETGSDESILCYLALGSNMQSKYGDSLATLQAAVRMLDESEAICVDAISSVYRTKPVGYMQQPSFFNAVVRITTSLSPEELLIECNNIENRAGRVRTIKNGPRTLDLDILLYGDRFVNTDNLIIPHERMFERAFVLVPLNDVIDAKQAVNIAIDKKIARCKDTNDVEMIGGLL